MTICLFLNPHPGGWSGWASTLIVRHVLISDLAFRISRTVKEERSGTPTYSEGGEVKFNVYLTTALKVIDGPDAASHCQHARTCCQELAAATEAILTGLSVEQNNVARIRLILQASAEYLDSKATSGSVARCICCGASDSGCACRETRSGRRRANHSHARAVVSCRGREVNHFAAGRRTGNCLRDEDVSGAGDGRRLRVVDPDGKRAGRASADGLRAAVDVHDDVHVGEAQSRRRCGVVDATSGCPEVARSRFG